MKKVLLALLVVVVLVVGGAAVFVASKPSLRPASSETVEATPDRLARGQYLVENVLLCMDCHSERHMDRYGYPPKEHNRGGGGSLCWDEDMGLEGFHLCAPNITPDPETGLGSWTDGEIMRAIREGVNKDGKALFPAMPYTEFASLSDNDVRAVVAYLRRLPPVKNKVPERVLPGPLNIIVKFMPKPLAGPVPDPDHNDPVAYGQYLATVANCKHCHTPVDDKHRPLPGKDFSGGLPFKHKLFGEVVTANLTPHETGLGNRSQEEFVALIKAFDSPEAQQVTVAHENNTVMPWLTVSGMTEEDLGAIYAYLRTVPALENSVTKRPRPVLPQPPAVAEPEAPSDEAPQDQAQAL